MARKTNTEINGKQYYRLTRTVGHKLNKAGYEIPIRKSFYGKSKAEAEEKYKDYMSERSQGIDPTRRYFGATLENWIDTFFIGDPRIANSTKELYLTAWRNHLIDADITQLQLKEISAETLQRFYNKLDCKPAAIKKLHNLLRRFFKYAEVAGYCRDCTGPLMIPGDISKHAEKEKEIVTWTDEEIQAILEGLSEADSRFRFRFMIIMLLNTGCRISEICGLKYEDIDEKNMTVTIRRQVVTQKELTTSSDTGKSIITTGPLKTDTAYRTIPLESIVLKELAIHKRWQTAEMLHNQYRTDFIFTTASGKLYDRKNIQTGLSRYYNRIGLEPYKIGANGVKHHKSPHTYRHTFASSLARRNVPIQNVAALLGHKDISITKQYYVSVSANEKRSAIRNLPWIV